VVVGAESRWGRVPGEMEQMVAFVAVEPQRPGQRGEHLR